MTMAAKWLETITGSFDDKRRWRAYKARQRQLPARYRTAMEGLERYLMYSGSIVKGDVMMRMSEDLLELFETAAADGTAIRAIVGDDPVEFADTFMQNYRDGQWIAKERQRLADAIQRAEGEAST
jgi:DNA-binding ferritin-like protein (Dps family)